MPRNLGCQQNDGEGGPMPNKTAANYPTDRPADGCQFRDGRVNPRTCASYPPSIFYADGTTRKKDRNLEKKIFPIYPIIQDKYQPNFEYKKQCQDNLPPFTSINYQPSK